MPVVSRCAVLKGTRDRVAGEQDGNNNADRRPRDLHWREPRAQGVIKVRAGEALPSDRRFGDVNLFEFLESLDDAPELRSFELAARGSMKRAF